MSSGSPMRLQGMCVPSKYESEEVDFDFDLEKKWKPKIPMK
jgi:hypothetical protein